MQLWDESRNANNALEAVRDNHWLAPTYAGRVDHWNTKPPLLIWMIAGLMKAGMAPLWALRAPGIAAALATLAAVWAAPRFALRDRLGGLLAGAALVGSSLYFGIHVTRTGDYDGPESLFVLSYVLCFWRAYEARSPLVWVAGAAGFFVLAVLTKGVAGALPAPGLAALAFARREVSWTLIKDWRTWAFAVAAAAVCLGYYLSRETYDPGYLQAVASNELGGRFHSAMEGHAGTPLYYVLVLALTGGPAMLLAPLAFPAAAAAASPRRDLVLALFGAAGSLLLALTAATTKIFWYAAPAIPLLSLAAGVGAADAIHMMRCRGRRLGVIVAAGVGGVLTIGAGDNLVRALRLADTFPDMGDSRIQYGPFMTRLQRGGLTPPVTIIDSKFWDTPAAFSYEPIVEFYSRLYGGSWRIVKLRPNQAPSAEGAVLTCDAKAIGWIKARYALAPLARSDACLIARLSAPGA